MCKSNNLKTNNCLSNIPNSLEQLLSNTIFKKSVKLKNVWKTFQIIRKLGSLNETTCVDCEQTENGRIGVVGVIRKSRKFWQTPQTNFSETL